MHMLLCSLWIRAKDGASGVRSSPALSTVHQCRAPDPTASSQAQGAEMEGMRRGEGSLSSFLLLCTGLIFILIPIRILTPKFLLTAKLDNMSYSSVSLLLFLAMCSGIASPNQSSHKLNTDVYLSGISRETEPVACVYL